MNNEKITLDYYYNELEYIKSNLLSKINYVVDNYNFINPDHEIVTLKKIDEIFQISTLELYQLHSKLFNSNILNVSSKKIKESEYFTIRKEFKDFSNKSSDCILDKTKF